jgi:hypothetical protein
VSGYLHPAAVLSPGKEAMAPTGEEAGVDAMAKTKLSLPLPGIEPRPLVQPVA